MLPKRKTIAYAHAGMRIDGCRAMVSGRMNSNHENGVGSIRRSDMYWIFIGDSLLSVPLPR